VTHEGDGSAFTLHIPAAAGHATATIRDESLNHQIAS
jgi:hypothetical protein